MTPPAGPKRQLRKLDIAYHTSSNMCDIPQTSQCWFEALSNLNQSVSLLSNPDRATIAAHNGWDKCSFMGVHVRHRRAQQSGLNAGNSR